MKHFDISSLFKTVCGHLAKNKSSICIGIGITLSVTSTASAVWATVKAVKKVNGKPLTKAEKFKEVWYYYIPAVASEAFGIAFFIGAHKLDEKQNAALAAAYSMTTAAFKEYKEKVKETLGDKKEESVRDEVMKDKIDKSLSAGNEVYITTNGDTLFYDPISDTLFTSNVNAVRKAVNIFNRDMLSEDYKSFNELCYEFGINGLKDVGDRIGWRIEDGYIDVRFVGHVTEDERPCLALEFNIEPVYGFDKLR